MLLAYLLSGRDYASIKEVANLPVLFVQLVHCYPKLYRAVLIKFYEGRGNGLNFADNLGVCVHFV